MFQFAGLPLPDLWVRSGVAGNGPRRVAPFGDPRVVGHVPLTAAYRSLSRPSSASSAKASAVCPYHLLFSTVRYIHTQRAAVLAARAIRCDLLEKENIVFVTLCGSQGARGGPSGPGTAPREGAPRDLAAWTRRVRPPNGKICNRLNLSKEVVLPRKEVIQPHLPVRLPCYDFTPLTLHTFGTSPHCWLGRRLRVQTTRVV